MPRLKACTTFALAILLRLGSVGAANATSGEVVELVKSSTSTSTGSPTALAVELVFKAKFNTSVLYFSALASEGWEVASAQFGSVRVEPGQQLVISLTLRASAAHTALEGEFVVVHTMVGRSERAAGTSGFAHYFQVVEGRLMTRSQRAYFESVVIADPYDSGNRSGLPFQGAILPPKDPNAWPDEVEGLDPAEARELTGQLRLALGEEVAVVTAALSPGAMEDGPKAASAPVGQDVAAADYGCGSSPVSSLLICLVGFLILAFAHRPRKAVIVGAMVALLTGFVGTSRAAMHCAWGTLVFWDMRGNEEYPVYATDEHPGWLLEECNAADTDCAPAEADCCFTAVPGVELVLLRHSGGTTTNIAQASVPSEASGLFSVCDSSWISGYTYTLRINHKVKATALSTSPPASYQIEPWASSTAYWTDISIGSIPSTSTSLGQISLNPAGTGNYSHVGGQVASIGRIAWDTSKRLQNAGETRHQRTFDSSNTYDLIHLKFPDEDGFTSQYFDQSTASVGNLAGRGTHVSLAMGQLWIARATGGSPFFVPNPINISPTTNFTGEGLTLTLGLAKLTSMMYLFDPQVAGIVDILADYRTCETAASSLTNEASNESNTILGLWELLDADTSNAQHSKSDNTNVSIKIFMDALVGMASSTGGANGDIDEATFTPTGTFCTSGCSAGQICGLPGSNKCINGDVHGANVRDIVRHLPSGTTTLATQYEDTLISCECLGSVDNLTSGGFSGGFRND